MFIYQDSLMNAKKEMIFEEFIDAYIGEKNRSHNDSWQWLKYINRLYN